MLPLPCHSPSHLRLAFRSEPIRRRTTRIHTWFCDCVLLRLWSMVRAAHLAGIGGTCTSCTHLFLLSLVSHSPLPSPCFSLYLSPSRLALLPPLSLVKYGLTRADNITLALSSWMAGHHCNVVFGNYHGLFPESSRAQIHSVRSMSSLISAYPILNANLSFFLFLVYPHPSLTLHQTAERSKGGRGWAWREDQARRRRWRG